MCQCPIAVESLYRPKEVHGEWEEMLVEDRKAGCKYDSQFALLTCALEKASQALLATRNQIKVAEYRDPKNSHCRVRETWATSSNQTTEFKNVFVRFSRIKDPPPPLWCQLRQSCAKYVALDIAANREEVLVVLNRKTF